MPASTLPTGPAIRAARLRAGLSQTELGRRAGVDLRTVQRLEAGAVDTRLGTLTRILGALNVAQGG